MSQRMYAEDAEFIHTLFTVKGKQNIFGAHNSWDFLMRKSEAKIKSLGELPSASFTMCHRTAVTSLSNLLLSSGQCNSASLVGYSTQMPAPSASRIKHNSDQLQHLND